MRSIVIKRYGDPDVLSIEERPDPKPKSGHVLIEVKAFGVNHAETHMREGKWPEATEISGIECAGLDPIPAFMPLMQLPSGVHFSLFGSFMFGTPEFPTSEIPMQTIVERVEDGTYKAKPARVFRFEEIREAHRLMEASAANGKIVVRV
jgi:NADPH:quinone reductase-like Zn-dependent oxidoreductase